ncbi:MAG TPA: hypothetical protein DEZ08_01145 [Dehalococcoidia bacterium]|nr:hypothetical protein [Dehalococcoidia bacterium]
MDKNSQQIINSLKNSISNLYTIKQTLNDINVFPVPDGDTGNNMYLTFENILPQEEFTDVSDMVSYLNSQLLLHSKGNSGVILSSFLSQCLTELAISSLENPKTWIAAFSAGYTSALNSIATPKNGTMLSVMQVISNISLYSAESMTTLDDFFQKVVNIAWNETENSSQELPELKAANVIDSGSAGFTAILFGIASEFSPRIADIYEETYTPWVNSYLSKIDKPSLMRYLASRDSQEEWGYCTQFIVNKTCGVTKTKIEDMFEQFPTTQSLVVLESNSFLKIHVHSDDPEPLLEHFSNSFQIDNISCENMSDQSHSYIGNGIVVVLPSSDFTDLFQSLGIYRIIIWDHLLEPPEAVFRSISNIKNLSEIFIITCSKFSLDVISKSIKKMNSQMRPFLCSAVTIPEAVGAILEYDQNLSPSDNQERIRQKLNEVTTTTLLLTSVDGLISHQLRDETIIRDLNWQNLMFQIITSELRAANSLITIYHGSNITTKELTQFTDRFTQSYGSMELETYGTSNARDSIILSIE